MVEKQPPEAAEMTYTYSVHFLPISVCKYCLQSPELTIAGNVAVTFHRNRHIRTGVLRLGPIYYT